MATDMDDNYKILVVEDDATLCETLQFNLELEGFIADTALSAEDALKLNLASYDLILLDVMMGEMSGFKFAKLLKQDEATSSIPIIFCTARDNEDDMVTGFNLGADDYIYKPYTIRNVLTRVRAVLKRQVPAARRGLPKITYEGLELDLDFKRCMVDGREAKLVKKEFEILALLLSNRGHVFSREEILDKVWKGEAIVLDRTIDVNITRIRRKIAPYGEHILTKSGYGYGFE